MFENFDDLDSDYEESTFASVQRGLQQAAEGRGRYLGSFAKYAELEAPEVTPAMKEAITHFKGRVKNNEKWDGYFYLEENKTAQPEDRKGSGDTTHKPKERSEFK